MFFLLQFWVNTYCFISTSFVEFNTNQALTLKRGMKVTINKKEDRPLLVSIIIVNFNGGPLLIEAIRAALASDVSIELFVSDNGSTDSSLNAVYKIFGKDKRIHIISNGSNLGFSCANNVALKQTRGRYILILNPDCIVQPDTLSKVVKIMDANPDAGVAGCLIRNPNGSEQAGCRRAVPTPWRSLVRVLHLNKIFPHNKRFSSFLLHEEPLPSQPMQVEAVSGAFMMVRRKAVEEVGALDENYFMHCEDIDWCMRFRQANWKVLFIPGVEVIHYKGTCSKDRPIRVLFHMHRGMVRFYRKFFHRQYPLPLMSAVVITIWVRFVLLTLKAMVMPSLRKGDIHRGNLYTRPSTDRRSPETVITYIGPERRTRQHFIAKAPGRHKASGHENTGH
jgi:GT2 family glycosyltransferase